MTKKILIYTLCFVLALTVCAFADEATQPNEETATEESAPVSPRQGQMPQRGQGMGGQRPQGGPGVPRGDGNMQSPEISNSDIQTETPQMPENQTDNGEFTQPPQMPEGEITDGQMQNNNRFAGGRGFPGGNFEEMFPAEAETGEQTLTSVNILKEYFTPTISVVLLALAFVFVIFYKRKTY